MIKTTIAAAVLALSAASGALAQAQRAEAPVKEVVLSDGTRRYAVPIKVGGTDIVAGLDSGSTGLRILPNVLHDGDVQSTGRSDDYSYGAGAKLTGSVGDGTVSVGGLASRVTVQLVKAVGCSDEKPHCAAGSVPIEHYGIQGDGLPDEGFKAILGVNMAHADVASAFAAMGARRWIIELPRPGEPGPGRIILNPTDEEAQGYVNLPVMSQFASQRGGLHDAVEGCLINDKTQEKLCGAVDLDTGAPGIMVVTRSSHNATWAAQTPATLVFADRGGEVRVAETLVIGRREHASALHFQQNDRAPTTEVMTGLTAYFAYSVLYDPGKGTIGFKARPPATNGPTAVAPK